MRYESLASKIRRWLGDAWFYLKDEFGNWAYVVVGVLLLLLYKPVAWLFNAFSVVATYIIGGVFVLLVLYFIYKKIAKR